MTDDLAEQYQREYMDANAALDACGVPRVRDVTGETITDEQIRSLRVNGAFYSASVVHFVTGKPNSKGEWWFNASKLDRKTKEMLCGLYRGLGWTVSVRRWTRYDGDALVFEDIDYE